MQNNAVATTKSALFKPFLLLPLIAFLTACPSPNKKHNSPSARKKSFTMGNPLNLIEGTQRDPKIDLEFLKKIKAVYLNNFHQYNELAKAEVQKPVTKKTLEAGQEAPQEERDSGYSIKFNVSVDENSQSVLFTSEKDSRSWVKILPTQTQYGFDVESSDGKKNTHTNLVHFSVSADRNMFSMLFYEDYDKKIGGSVSALYFVIDPTKSPTQKTSSEYLYRLGPGVKVGWNKKEVLKIDICGTNHTPESVREINDSIAKWSSALKGRLKFSPIEVSSRPRPFSDLNQHCVYLMNDYILDQNESSGELGHTITLTDPKSTFIVDSDIIIFTKEFEKSGVEYSDFRLKSTRINAYMHEFGHLLGLAHQFTGKPSIMSYDDLTTLTEYDIKAVQALYQ